LTGVIQTPTMSMVKTQVYLRAEDLEALHRVTRGRPVAELVREAVRAVWLAPTPGGPVGLFDGEINGSAADHDAAFDEI
jgi:hypothetical protein